jgi:uncharacterized protein
VIEPRRLVVHEEELPLPHWHADPLRVAALSDFHPGSAARLREIVDRTNALAPDVTVLLGDFVQTAVGRSLSPEEVAAELSRLRARLGVWAVLGNHDWWLDGDRVHKALADRGIQVLENRAAQVGPIWLAGVADFMTRDSDPRVALRNVPKDATILVITHEPDTFPAVASSVALTLAGHTHGGQVRLPFVGPLIVPSRFGRKYAAGHVVEDGRHLFVTTGLGTSILPLRLGVPPEIALLSLRRLAPP